MDPMAIGGFALGAGLVLAKLMDKLMSGKADAQLATIVKLLGKILDVQNAMHADARVDRERLGQVMRGQERLQERIESHMGDEDAIMRTIAGHLASIKGGVNT
jgi:hypothetical protein